MKLINLTPHSVNVYAADTCVDTIPSSGLARCATTSEMVGTVVLGDAEVPVKTVTFGEVSGLPEPDGETRYIVSQIVASACKGLRDDLLIPADIVRRDEAGNLNERVGDIVGCRAFARV